MLGNLLEMRNIIKDFPGVRALDHVTLEVKENEIHALCGENGAGKSTLINILSGVYPYKTYEGEIFINGEKREFLHIKNSEEAGIAVIHQELALFEELNITENLFMNNQKVGRFGIDWAYMYKETEKWLERLKIRDCTPKTLIRNIGVGKQQLIEIAKAMRKNARILILDEPSAALTDSEIDILMENLAELKAHGVTCIYISHKLDEIERIADSVTVIRDGKNIDTKRVEDVDEAAIIQMMVGREINDMYPERNHQTGEEILEVSGFQVYSPEMPEKAIVKDASFNLKKGEILGLSGLMGAGRTELVMSLFGGFPGKYHGKVKLDGKEVSIRSPIDALKLGFAFLSEDRKSLGIIPTMDVKSNVSIACLRDFVNFIQINESKEIYSVKEFVKKLNVKTTSLETNIQNLSGGNQQKAILARNLLVNPKVLIIDEPTRGIDVGAKNEIYVLMNELTASGISILMVSSELPEILGMSDRILVLCEGEIVKEFDNRGKDISQEDIMFWAAGGNKVEK
ncbi:MAG TPA: sugar ABC transporter ATP-binding protein [Thermotogota bacterium]|nr:sugar ABC transporter ATP-binding protein [Thermotogota bacterium]HPJ89536.1 sugar ABC transporter ATP-binding protein [Thermotogota bacterium]HPR96621.1 sugar ABC transporter ATP-binding protein [Thermotogota bacterium]